MLTPAEKTDEAPEKGAGTKRRRGWRTGRRLDTRVLTPSGDVPPGRTAVGLVRLPRGRKIVVGLGGESPLVGGRMRTQFRFES